MDDNFEGLKKHYSGIEEYELYKARSRGSGERELERFRAWVFGGMFVTAIVVVVVVIFVETIFSIGG